MSTLKRFQEEDTGFESYLSLLLDRDCLDGAASGITKKVLADGRDSLSDKQEYIFSREVIGSYSIEKCKRCACDISWHDMDFAIDSGFCPDCEHSHERIMSE